MMATAAVISVSAGKRLLSTAFWPADLAEKISSVQEHTTVQLFPAPGRNHNILAQKCPNFAQKSRLKRQLQASKALKEPATASSVSVADDWLHDLDADIESSLEALIMLQKSMLEMQLELPFDGTDTATASPGERDRPARVVRSGSSARQRRTTSRSNVLPTTLSGGKRFTVAPALLRASRRGYVRGIMTEDLLSHAEVISLSTKIKTGLLLEEHREKLKEKMGAEPSNKQLASSLRMPCAELHSRLLECALAREKLAMSNVRLVMSIAQKYDSLGIDLADLVQGGLIGLLRGIEKFDSSKGFKISTYVYWWIRQGVTRALARNSRTLRLPAHLHERLSSIRTAKLRLEGKGISPSIDKLAESLNMSQKKVLNATEAISKVLSLDREAFPSLNGLAGETFHSYIADRNLSNNPWHGFEEWSLKDEVDDLLTSVLSERERNIIRLYHGLDRECKTWEDIGKEFGLSRERVRQVGLVAMEKLKHAARKRRLEAMLVGQ